MKKLHWCAGIILGFSVIAALLITSFEIAMYADFDVYRQEYEKYDVLSELDMTMDDVMYVTHEMMDYLRGEGDTLSVVTTVEGQEQDFFNEQDRFHMGEVRELFIGGLNIRFGACVAAVLCVLFLVITRADIKKVVPRSYWIALGVTGAAVILIGIAAVVDFNAVFVQFHHIFFDNDLWIFDPAEDYMIRMLPEGLFYDMVMRIGAIFLVSLVVLLVLSFIPKIADRRKKLV
ncbi:TIGR01906 family membrane protein [Mediterraneibacter glycyrrhizinilyticus]|uniref:TIGR01906 family membrane protein n=1 Tax=Mediterraneibacter glycyrrhizinilyticus TaxID=342942 RepID=UPI0025A4093B|nr:TIGR01906 family membrane protein [Mediterraneibacter glycyrrhizinilyticus]MDM8126540.1 TIGR01906 family membrane protein [Mediterraneibacter glycyrrhizinilyticus]